MPLAVRQAGPLVPGVLLKVSGPMAWLLHWQVCQMGRWHYLAVPKEPHPGLELLEQAWCLELVGRK